jgi:hypothetical protein
MTGDLGAGIYEPYAEDGFLSPVDILTADEALHHRAALEAAEAEVGPLHYKAKVHTILRSPLALATHPKVLDVVEALLGPDILVYDAYREGAPYAQACQLASGPDLLGLKCGRSGRHVARAIAGDAGERLYDDYSGKPSFGTV